MPFTVEKIARLLRDIQPTIWRESIPIPTFKFREEDVLGAYDPAFNDSGWATFTVGDRWGGYDVIAWFRADVPIPPHLRDHKLALRFLVGPRDGGGSTAETMLYVNGVALQGIDVWHEEAWLPPEALHGDSISLALRAWSGVLEIPPRRQFKLAALNRIDEGAEQFYHTADNLLRAIKGLHEDDWRRVQLLDVLNQAANQIRFTKPRSDEYYESLREAADFLARSLQELAHETHKPAIIGVGHAHIDVAWLWRIRHSRDKAGRTFATALHLMRQYPEYRFLHSTPQLYQYLEHDYPEIFERVRQRIHSGEWEITGGMWVEPDTNIPNGESLIRQILFGKRYIRETFGLDTTVVWLPDVFGYSYALPQIIAKSGLKIFTTTKISWSQFNRFPHDTFYWRGLDGTDILTHFITAPEPGSRIYTYNATLDPVQVKRTWDVYNSKSLNDELLIAFGWGDGGGGPTKEMLESARVLRNLPGYPTVEMGHTEPYFEQLTQRVEGKDVPVWDGELYLEFHRGTYTSQAQNKRANRLAEILYHNAEWMNTLADTLTGESHYADLREGWELILLNQFHDILPGSSIRPVYEDSALDYARITEIGQTALDAAQQRITANVASDGPGLVVFNGLSWTRGGLVELPAGSWHGAAQRNADGTLLVEVRNVPSLGYAVIPATASISSLDVERSFPGPAEPAAVNAVSTMAITTDYLENAFYIIRLNERGQIVSLFDKRHGREVQAPSERGNVFQAFEDKPMEFDAWDIDLYYQEKMQEIGDLIEARVEETGPLRGTLRLVWRFYDSTITQRLSIYRGSPRIDFRTEIDWHESDVLLKAAFPVDIRATYATYDIQFGNLTRPNHWNTSWDYARFEVCAHKWADLSEGGYGVALLNDCKYGYDVKANVMRLTLLKSATMPDEQADKGRHVFTYSLLPHGGDWKQAPVVHEAYDLNHPLLATPIKTQTGTLPASHSFAMIGTLDRNVILETVKRAEDGDGWIVRVYEYMNQRNSLVTIEFGQFIRSAVECKLVEEGEQPVEFAGRRIGFSLKPYEIRTFRVRFEDD